MHHDSSRNPDEAGHDAPEAGLRVRRPAHPVAAQAAGPDAARETGAVTKPSQGRGSAGLTERLAAASARRARRVLAIWGIAVVVALILAGTSLRGLTTGAHVVGTTPSSQAEALYQQALGAPGSQRPTDVIVVSSKSSTVSDGTFQQVVTRLAARVRTDPGVTQVATGLSAGSRFVSPDRHATLIALRAASDAGIKPVIKDARAANGSGGFAVAVTGDHTAGNDFTTLPASDLQHGELDFGLPVSIVILLLVFGAVVAGLMPALMALLSIIVGLGIAALLAREFSLSVFTVNMMTGMGLALGIDYSLFIISRFREERGHGRGKEPAIRITGATASRAVLFSGSTFVVALLGMFLVPVTLLRSLAAGAVIVGVVSVAAALTLLPAMLSLAGDRVNSLPLPVAGSNLGRPGAAGARIWTALTATVMRRPAVSLPLAAGFMVLAAVPVPGLHIGQSGVTTLPGNLPSRQGYLAVQRYFPGQSQDPVQIVSAGGTGSARPDLAKLETALAGDPRFGPGAVRASPDGKILTLTVPIRGDAVSSQDVAAVLSVRQRLIPPAFAGSGARDSRPPARSPAAARQPAS
jgi:uncharacterized membrane protein YdfJ with MMPL/SSD domain